MRSNPAIPALFKALTLAAAALTCGPGARAQCPAWQIGFQAPGIGGDVHAFTEHADGSGQRVLVVGGYRLQIPGVPLFGTAVLTWDGSTLQALGSLPPDSIVHALQSWDDGSGPAIYAGGLFPSSPLLGIARWNGAAWENVGGGTNGRVHALEVFDDGTGPALYAGGEFTLAGGVTVRRVARWNGIAWSPVGSSTAGPNAAVYALAVWQDALGGPPALYAGGDFTGVGTSGANRIAKWDGTSWQPLGFGLDDRVTSIAAYDSGAGTALFVGGWFDTAGTVPARGIAGYDGYWWFGVGSPALQGGSPSVAALEVGDLGSGPRLYATGFFATAGGTPVNSSASWDGSQWHALGAGTQGLALAIHDDGSGMDVYCGGSFDFAGGIFFVGGVPSRGLARWDGSQWSSLQNGNGLIGTPFTSAVHDDGTGSALYVGGALFAAGSPPARNLARWDGSAWSTTGSGPNATVQVLASLDPGTGRALYAGGNFTEIDGSVANGIARWNGSAWTTVGGGLSGTGQSVSALTVFDDGTGPALIAGGLFTQIGGVPALNVARWDGSAWTALGAGAEDRVRALAVHDDGSGPALYAGGDFDTAGGVTAAAIARWNGIAWSALGAGLGAFTFEPRVHALRSFDDGNGAALYVGGEFRTADGLFVEGITRWIGGAFEALGAGITPGYAVKALAVFDEGTGRGPELFAAGRFPTLGNLQVSGIGRWNGTSWSGLAGGLAGGVGLADAASLQVYDAGLGGGPALFVTGEFEYAGATYSTGIAAWSSCGEIGRTLCFGDGSGTACPCGNASTPGDRDGCTNSTGLGGRLRASGTPSLSNDALVLAGSRMTNGSALYFQGTTRVNGGAGALFGDGLRCAAGTVVRLAVLANSGGASHYPRAGDPPVATQGAVAQPGVREYQVWFRDAASFCTPETFALTNAVEIVWVP